ncbi:alpha/beta hydrolase [Haloferula sp. A504]|uniref:PGAP1-like alpha/beta domain-containing protein n=1 Tax=Haloferula sp. A504 TaxID=3373601 RepID=UPI0031C52E00|nr:alpha/beta hydrolase [Verrucomicrobiaceae bacterium E54]
MRAVCILITKLALLLAFAGCANFQRLGEDLNFLDRTVLLTGRITNAMDHRNVVVVVAEWDRDENRVLSGDYYRIEDIGVFGFFVPNSRQQYLVAYSDADGNTLYTPGVDPAWIHSSASGEPAPVSIDRKTGRGRAEGALSKSTILPPGLVQAVRDFKGDRTDDEAASGWRIPITLGKVADLDDPKFSSERGSAGLWEPASFPLQSGIGIYFLERYDPKRIPVLFVYGAAGSPQDWQPFFERLDRRKYQPWFYYYPTGRRLDEMGAALNGSVELLQARYNFPRLHVVAHSMGGLVSRSFLVQHLDAGHRYIDRFVTISTPWAGHEFASMGVKRAPSVVPSWYDLSPGSGFLDDLFDERLKGRIDHLLIYGHKATRSMVLPAENDGTVSVASETAPDAAEDAVKVVGFDEDHVSILSNDEVFRLTEKHLAGKSSER